jgi:hypothetical protein
MASYAHRVDLSSGWIEVDVEYNYGDLSGPDRELIMSLRRQFAEFEENRPCPGGHDPVLAMAQAAHYFSTYCLHDDHEHCRLTCKTCGQSCRCPCHRGLDTGGES